MEYRVEYDTDKIVKRDILPAGKFEGIWEIVGLSCMKKLQEEDILSPYRCSDCGMVITEEYLNEPKRDRSCNCNERFKILKEQIDG